MINNKITKQEYYNKLDKINLLDYMIDYKRNMNYFFYKDYKYALCSELKGDYISRLEFNKENK